MGGPVKLVRLFFAGFSGEVSDSEVADVMPVAFSQPCLMSENGAESEPGRVRV